MGIAERSWNKQSGTDEVIKATWEYMKYVNDAWTIKIVIEAELRNNTLTHNFQPSSQLI